MVIVISSFVMVAFLEREPMVLPDMVVVVNVIVVSWLSSFLSLRWLWS